MYQRAGARHDRLVLGVSCILIGTHRVLHRELEDEGAYRVSFLLNGSFDSQFLELVLYYITRLHCFQNAMLLSSTSNLIVEPPIPPQLLPFLSPSIPSQYVLHHQRLYTFDVESVVLVPSHVFDRIRKKVNAICNHHPTCCSTCTREG